MDCLHPCQIGSGQPGAYGSAHGIKTLTLPLSGPGRSCAGRSPRATAPALPQHKSRPESRRETKTPASRARPATRGWVRPTLAQRATASGPTPCTTPPPPPPLTCAEAAGALLRGTSPTHRRRRCRLGLDGRPRALLLRPRQILHPGPEARVVSAPAGVIHASAGTRGRPPLRSSPSSARRPLPLPGVWLAPMPRGPREGPGKEKVPGTALPSLPRPGAPAPGDPQHRTLRLVGNEQGARLPRRPPPRYNPSPRQARTIALRPSAPHSTAPGPGFTSTSGATPDGACRTPPWASS